MRLQSVQLLDLRYALAKWVRDVDETGRTMFGRGFSVRIILLPYGQMCWLGMVGCGLERVSRGCNGRRGWSRVTRRRGRGERVREREMRCSGLPQIDCETWDNSTALSPTENTRNRARLTKRHADMYICNPNCTCYSHPCSFLLLLMYIVQLKLRWLYIIFVMVSPLPFANSSSSHLAHWWTQLDQQIMWVSNTVQIYHNIPLRMEI